MAQEYETAKSKTTAEIDAQFVAQHPIEGRVVQLGAAFTGATEAINKSIDEVNNFLSRAIEPGDMNPDHMPHPIDATIKSIASLTEPGDMRIENSPHPKDDVIAAINNKFKEIEQAGVIEGTRISATLAVSAAMDIIGPNGKAKTAANVVDEVSDVATELHAAKHLKDGMDAAATKVFLRDAVNSTEKQLKDVADEYARTAKAAKTFGTQFNRYAGHEEALIKFEIASIKLDALKYGGDASVNNPIISDLLKNGKDSSHFYTKNVMDEVNKYDASIPSTFNRDEIILATKLAHENRLKFLSEAETSGRVLTPAEQMELKVGSQYGADAAAHARQLIKNGEIEEANVLYSHRNNEPEAIDKTSIEATGRDRYGNLMSQNLGDYIKTRSSLIENMNVDAMRKLARTETAKLEQIIQIRESELNAQYPGGTDRRASQSPIPGVRHTSEEEFLIAKSGQGKRSEDESVRKASETTTYEGFLIVEAGRNRAFAELNVIKGSNPKLELPQFKAALEYLKQRQTLIDASEFDGDSERMREVFKKEEKSFNKYVESVSKIEPVSLNDAVGHLPQESQQFVLASIQEKIEINNRQSNDIEAT